VHPVVEPTIVCPEGSLGWVDKLLIAVWRSSSMEAAEVFYQQMRAGVLRHGSGTGHLAVIEPKSNTPSPAARKRIAQVFNEHPEAIDAVAVVFVGQGFFAATVGSVATAIMLLAHRAFPFRVYGNLGDAAHFFNRHMDFGESGLGPARLTSAVDALRERLYAPPRSNRPSRPSAL
jgi:hypothetical protein